jgi:transposase-like protein
MKSLKKTEQEKDAIIAEYLLGTSTYRNLEKKHGVDFRIIHSWVTKFEGKTMRHQKKPKNQKPESAPKSHPMNQLLKSEIVFNWNSAN